jgi:hypothetical protein
MAQLTPVHVPQAVAFTSRVERDASADEESNFQSCFYFVFNFAFNFQFPVLLSMC